MGFFASGGKAPKSSQLPIELLHKRECKACPLNHAKVDSPKMEPSGSTKPFVYMLGEAPSTTDDQDNEQFVGEAGQLVRKLLPKGWGDDIRWNNVVRTHPPNRDPDPVEIECCRPSIVRDIEAVKPHAIFGFGMVPLKWALAVPGDMTAWRGRRVPVRIGKHLCWYYALSNPLFILRLQNPRDQQDTLRHDMARAFNEIDKGLPTPEVHTREDAERNIELITSTKKGDADRVVNFLAEASKAAEAGVDYETNGLRPYRDHTKILTMAVSLPGKTVAWPLHHKEAKWAKGDLPKINEAWTDFIKSKCRKIVHNLAFEMEWTAVKYYTDLIRSDTWEDTQSQAFILDERVGKSKPGCFALDFLVLQHFGLRLKGLSMLDRTKIADEPMMEVLLYNAMDAKYHRLLFLAQQARLLSAKLLPQYKMMLRRVSTVVMTQIKGVPVDQKMVEKLSKELSEQLAAVEKAVASDPTTKLYERRRGQPFNPASNKETLYLVQRVIGAHVDSVDEEALKGVGKPICNHLLKFREISKLKSTYVDPLLAGSPLIYADGLLHPVLNTTFTETGRLSSEDPNEQNFPKHQNRHVRRQVKAFVRWLLASFDYGQIEARVIAMASKDKRFVRALWERYDVHKEWGERIAKECPSWAKGHDGDAKVMRQEAKNLMVFPAFFGAQDIAIAGYLGIPEIAAKRLLREFWRQFIGVREWQEQTLADYRRDGYVEYLTGRRRRGPLSPNQLFNAPIQGVAADIVLDAQERLSAMAQWHLQPNMNVHDDLTFHWPEEEFERLAKIVIEVMLKVDYPFVNVPITIEAGIGDDWCDVNEVGKYSSDDWKGVL